MLCCLIRFIVVKGTEGKDGHPSALHCILLLTTTPALTETGTLPDADVAVYMGNTISSLQFKIPLCPGPCGRTVGR